MSADSKAFFIYLAHILYFCAAPNVLYCRRTFVSNIIYMKKLLLLLPVLALILSQCSNDFDVTADWKEIPVVYAFLNPKDSAHYIRVEKAFLDPETSAYTIADIADSLYYPADAIAVFIEIGRAYV